jgi:signal transduction histidine kinase
VYDAQGRVMRTNATARRLLGWDAAPPGYRDLSLDERIAHYAPRDAQGEVLTPQAWRALRAERDADVPGVPESFDLVLRSLDGRDLEVSANFALLRYPNGQVVGGVLLLSDRTERNRLERERQEAEARELAAEEVARQLDRFFSIASHDIRSPATAAGGFVQLAQARAQLLADRLQALDERSAQLASGLLAVLESADQSYERLQRLATRLFDTAQAGAGKLTLSLRQCDLVRLVGEQVAGQQMAALDRDLEVELPNRQVSVEADADRLGQVLSNYLTNALKYSANDAPVVVRVEVTAGAAIVSVRDQGPGLPPEEQARVWELYHRAPGITMQSSLGASSGSLGVGLYVCKSLIELHPGGQVGVDRVVGEGSTFWFSLPVITSGDSVEPPGNAAELAGVTPPDRAALAPPEPHTPRRRGRLRTASSSSRTGTARHRPRAAAEQPPQPPAAPA